MNRSEKEELVSQIRSKLLSAKSVIVTRQTGLTVAQVTDLRGKIREAGAEFKVLKNTLARLAVKDTPLDGISGLLEGPTALAYSTDPVSAAKAVSTFANSNEKLTIVGGYLDGQILNAKAVDALAKLPSLDELRSKIIAVINTPATRLAVLAKEPAACVTRVIAARGRGE
jgi:large subunit ribosomal protein L10